VYSNSTGASPRRETTTRLVGGVTRGSLMLAASVTDHHTPAKLQQAVHTEVYKRSAERSQQQQPVMGRFHCVLRFGTVALAHTSHSLVRVPRREAAPNSIFTVKSDEKTKIRQVTNPHDTAIGFDTELNNTMRSIP
jgi:hypothetical protein